MTVSAAAVPPPIVFSHGNGFPAGTYRALFEIWRAAGHEVHAIERFGHDPRYPVTSNWPHLVDQLLHFVDAVARQPVLYVGHSLGGIVSTLAAARRPARAHAVILLDAPVIAGWRAQGLRWLKASGLIRRAGPGNVARARRQRWPDREALRAHFAAKPVFARWDPRVLDDYLDSAFHAEGTDWVLNYDRDIEARIYETLPDHVGRVLARHPLRCPAGFIAGRDSAELRQVGAQASRRFAGAFFEWSEGTHLFPMERPGECAAQVLRLIERLQRQHPG